jgi:aryl-alcohol dehydrogenase-like predicted oxidoreductase
VGFNLLNQTARERVLQPAIEANVGVMDMFAVRQALRDPETVARHLRAVASDGTLPSDADVEGAIAVLERHVGTAAVTLPDLSYRFVRAEPGISTVLVGTGNPAHMRDNLASFGRPPLDAAVLEELRGLLPGIEALNGETGERHGAPPPPPSGWRTRLGRLLGR